MNEFFVKLPLMNVSSPIQAILVPQGAEYQAVCRGIKQTPVPRPAVFAIPMGSKPVIQHLKQLQQAGLLNPEHTSQVLLIGLCGSLTPRYAVGDCLLCQNCVYQSDSKSPVLKVCDAQLTAQIQAALGEVALETVLTSDRLVYAAQEKYRLNQAYDAAVVDMEGFAVLETLAEMGLSVAMLRVVSDDCHHDIPDLTGAIDAEGRLKPLPMAIAFLQQPIAAMRLIRGSLKGLQTLQSMTTRLFTQLQ